jgi:2,3-diaminopropionate biosynthesis protein SbnB
MTFDQLPAFSFVGAPAVAEALNSRPGQVMDLVEKAYRLHGAGETVNPQSVFLRLPDSPRSRAIALPAAVGGDVHAMGLKWIASFPDNLARGLPRASAVLLLNDRSTGFPVACLESSIISATRTAASAVLAADRLSAGRRGSRIGFVGAGLINGYLQRYLTLLDWPQTSTAIHDQDVARAERFADRLRRAGHPDVTVSGSAEEVVAASELVGFATSAPKPYLLDPAPFAHHPLVLHISLRDLGPRVLLDSVNVVDDREHCLRENTSAHLTALEVGDASFLDATIPEVLTGAYRPPEARTVIVSPFGLGALDIVLADFVLGEALARGTATTVQGFFAGADDSALLPVPRVADR